MSDELHLWRIVACQIKKKDTDKVQKCIFWLWWHEILGDIG